MPTRTDAPRLRGQPCDHLEAVVLLAAHVLVLDQSVGVADAGDVDAGAGVTVGGEPAVHRLVSQTGAVAAPVRDVLEHRRHGRVGAGLPGQEQPSRQGSTIGQRNEHRLDLHDQLGGLDDRRFRHRRDGSASARADRNDPGLS